MKHKLLALLTSLFLGAVASAQTMWVTPTNPSPGDPVTIHFNDPTRAGQTVKVTVSDGGFPEITETVEIALDDTGKGTGTWLVRDWFIATFIAEGVEDVTILIY